MRRAGLTIIALVIGTALSGAAWAQTAGGGGATGGGAGAGGWPAAEPGGAGATGVPAGPVVTPGTAGQNQLTPTMPTGSPTQRTVTGVNQNEQLRTTPGAPSDTTSTGAGAMPNDAPAGSTTTRTRLGPGSETGRVPRDSNANVATGVEGPGQLSRPTAFELHSGRVRKHLSDDEAVGILALGSKRCSSGLLPTACLVLGGRRGERDLPGAAGFCVATLRALAREGG